MARQRGLFVGQSASGGSSLTVRNVRLESLTYTSGNTGLGAAEFLAICQLVDCFRPAPKQADLTCLANGSYDVKLARVSRVKHPARMAQNGTGKPLFRMVLVPARRARKASKAWSLGALRRLTTPAPPSRPVPFRVMVCHLRSVFASGRPGGAATEGRSGPCNRAPRTRPRRGRRGPLPACRLAPRRRGTVRSSWLLAPRRPAR
jgi:hypothetical protein